IFVVTIFSVPVFGGAAGRAPKPPRPPPKPGPSHIATEYPCKEDAPTAFAAPDCPPAVESGGTPCMGGGGAAPGCAAKWMVRVCVPASASIFNVLSSAHVM